MILLYEQHGRIILDIPGWMTGNRVPEGARLLRQWPHYVRYRSLSSFLRSFPPLYGIDTVHAFSAGGLIAYELLARGIITCRFIDMHGAPCAMPLSTRRHPGVIRFAAQLSRHPYKTMIRFYKQCGEGVVPLSNMHKTYPHYWYTYIYHVRPSACFSHMTGRITHGADDMIIPSAQAALWRRVFPLISPVIVAGPHAKQC